MGEDATLRRCLMWLAMVIIMVGIYTHSFKKMMVTYFVGLGGIAGVLLPDWDYFDREISKWTQPVSVDHINRSDVLRLGSTRSRFIRLKDVPSVREVNITGFDADLGTFVKFVREFRNVQVFKFSVEDCKASNLKELDFPKSTWKRLHIMSQLHANALLTICNVLRSCESLEELIIYTDLQHDLGITYDHDMLSRAFAFPCSMDQLKTVTMRGYEASCQGLLLLAEHLLKSSVILETLIIYPSENQVDVLEEFMFVKQLKSFPRASSAARIIFGSEVY